MAGSVQPADRPNASEGRPAPSSGLEAGIGFRLGRLQRRVRADWSRQLAELGLSPPQAAVLRAVAERPDCSLRALARVLGAEPMRAKRCVDELEQRGLLESAHRGGDRRSRGLALTSAGEDLSRQAEARADAHERRLRALLGPQRRAGLEEAFTVLERGLGVLARPGTADPGPPAASSTSTPATEEQSR